ncbi:hypothetical protein EUGRSUZ_F02960 [Eucalyptus grandis]|uniref:Uncharacterized protein n=2 Tax=Eucalyptus grandis TaxID=71139 RepID=A0ACC3KJL6_EUCGR|nr:hypothetical protein EUGRSUZ_F02960 [Eucalyptus grandis]
MTKGKKQLLSKAPWRVEDDDQSDKFKDAKLRVTSQPGQTPTMHVPRKKSRPGDADEEDESALDPELRYSFQRNFMVRFSPVVLDYPLEIHRSRWGVCMVRV